MRKACRLPMRRSKKWQILRNLLLKVSRPEVDHPNNWLGYFDRLNDRIQRFQRDRRKLRKSDA